MTAVTLQHLSRRYRETAAVESARPRNRRQGIRRLARASGCGKTTTLNMIAGVDAPTSGHILFDGQSDRARPARKAQCRDGLPKHRALPAQDRLRKHRVPAAHGQGRSGGDRLSACAAARSCCASANCSTGDRMSFLEASDSASPSAALRCATLCVFLFDEPLSALDAKLRGEMRVEIKKLHERLGSTFIYVTHDQVEAMTMADRSRSWTAASFVNTAPPTRSTGGRLTSASHVRRQPEHESDHRPRESRVRVRLRFQGSQA